MDDREMELVAERSGSLNSRIDYLPATIMQRGSHGSDGGEERQRRMLSARHGSGSGSGRIGSQGAPRTGSGLSLSGRKTEQSPGERLAAVAAANAAQAMAAASGTGR